MTDSKTHVPHIVVLGAGFGGLMFAKHFPDGLANVTVIDRTNHHLFQPLLYQVATAGLAVPDIAQPVRSILASKRDVTVLMDEVKTVDLTARRVQFVTAAPLAYDYLVLALGGRTSYFGHSEWEQHAPGLKSIEDAIRIRREVLGALERAEVSEDPAERRRLMTIVVIGGGPTGVELAGAFAELQRHVLAKDFRRLNLSMARVILIEAGPRVLPAFPERLSASARRQLEALGVNVWVGTPVLEIRPGEVVTANETVAAGNIIWAAGVSAVPLTASLGVEIDRGGRVKVGADLRVPGHPEVFAIGDMAIVRDAKDVTVPPLSPAAMQMGIFTAQQIVREIRAGVKPGVGERLPFRYFDKGIMATIGRSRAVALSAGLQFTGVLAWLMWLFVHLLFLIGFRNKLSVLLSWAYSYFTYRRGARVIYGTSAGGSSASASYPRK